MNISRSLVALVSSACLLATVSCASGRQEASADPFGGWAPGFRDPVQFTIQNNDFRDATVYGYWNGVRERVGMVIGKTSKTFGTEWKSETFAFYVDFVGGGEYMSETINVWPGDHLDFVIMPSW